MRPSQEATDARRVALVSFLVNTRGKSEIVEFDSFYKLTTVHKFIKRLRDVGIKIHACQKFEGKETVYKLDMPLWDAIAIIQPKLTEDELKALAERKTDMHRRAALKAHKRIAESHKPIGDFHPWWGILASIQTIEIGEIRCK